MNINYFELAQQFKTPLYVYEEAKLKEKFNALSQALHDTRHLIAYAVKANSNLSILKIFHELGSGFDIVSGGELARVKKATGKTSQIIFSGVGKTKQEIQEALSQKVKLINIESAEELSLVEAVAKETSARAPIAFRLNPDISIDSHPYIATGMRSSKFGIPIDDAPQLWNRIKNSPALELKGIDCHIGSQLSDIAVLKNAYTQVLSVAESLRSAGAPIKILDFGGGLGVSYSGHYEPLNLVAYGDMIRALVKDKDYEIVLEPGKFLVVESGTLLTEVLFRKRNHEYHFVMVDAGMNDLIRPALYEAYHKIDVIQKKQNTQLETVEVVGPVCESGCFFAHGRELPVSVSGDLLAIRDAGAYGFSMASNYNTRPKPAEVLIGLDGAPRIIRAREEISDLWRGEQ